LHAKIEGFRLTAVVVLQTVVILGLVIAGTVSLLKVNHQSSVVTCQQTYISKLSGVLATRAQAGNANRSASQAYARAVAITATGSTARRQAYAVYAANVTSTNQTLAANPIPTAHDC
jgi:hypothetical protein